MAAPYLPPFAQVMPSAALNALGNQYGLRLGWMKSHVCPCSSASGGPGSPDPRCLTCGGRGVYWDKPPVPFSGLITYMHTSAAPDEPGSFTDPLFGAVQRAEPTITIPSDANDNGVTRGVWLAAAEWDAFVEYDAISQQATTLVAGLTSTIPYGQNLQVQSVRYYDSTARTVTPVASGAFTVVGASVTVPGLVDGTPYTVEYTACPVYLAFRHSGGMAHTRPFGNGTSDIPRRFHAVSLDVWLRSRAGGDGPNSP